jgi:hypothetical protein
MSIEQSNIMKNKTTQKVRNGHVIRQGDVLLFKVEKLPKGAVRQRVGGDRVILALGEATGHHHSIAKKKARLFTAPTADGVQATIVEVATALAELEHQEHDPIPLARGFYEVRLQREYHPQEIRRVAD